MSDSSVGFIERRLVEARNLFVVGDVVGFNSALRDVVKLSGCFPVLGLDIDGVITDFPEIFKDLSNSWPGRVVVVSFCSDYDKAFKLLKSFEIYFDDLVLSPSLDKSEIIRSEKINIFIDDQDECVKNINNDVLVLKVRNGGNFAGGKWLYSTITGKLVGF